MRNRTSAVVITVYLGAGLTGCQSRSDVAHLRVGDAGSTDDAGQAEVTSETSAGADASAAAAAVNTGISGDAPSNDVSPSKSGETSAPAGPAYASAEEFPTDHTGNSQSHGSTTTPDVSPESNSSGLHGESGAFTDTLSSEPPAPALYMAHCASCHGEQGRGKPGEAPEIQHPVKDYATWIIRTGRSHATYLTEMPPFDEYLAPESEVADVLSYLNTFVQPTTGKGLFLDYCGNCHGADAKGGTTGHPLIGLTGAFEEAVRQGRNLNQMGSRTSYMPRWKEVELSDSEIGAMADYVLALDNTAK